MTLTSRFVITSGTDLRVLRRYPTDPLNQAYLGFLNTQAHVACLVPAHLAFGSTPL